VYIALVMVVWGAWKIMSSQGEPEKISAGRKTIQNGLIGLAVTIVATVVINYAGGQF
jgi:Type IV secretion system pilin